MIGGVDKMRMARDFGKGNMRRFRFSAIAPFAAAVLPVLLSAATSGNAMAADEIGFRSTVQASGEPDAAQRSPTVGANPNAPRDAGRTAVHRATSGGDARMLDALLRAGGKPDVRYSGGNASLHLASDASSSAARPNSGRVLLERKAAVAHGKGETSLRLVAEAHRSSAGLLWSTARTPGNLKIVRQLLASGVNPNVPDDAGRTAVHRAASGGGARILDALLRAGGKPDVRDGDGNAPLHIAIKAGGREGKVEVVEALLAGGADPCVKDATGRTPYRLAEDGGPIRRVLGRAGGNERACGKNGKRMMRVGARANVRSGPGLYYGRIGVLEVGYEVKVTGETGGWLHIEMPGGTGYIRAAQMIDTALVASLEPKCDGFSHTCFLCRRFPDISTCRLCRDFPVCWKRLSNRSECYLLVRNDSSRNRSLTWTGSCSGGVANGQGKLSSSMAELRRSRKDAGMLVDGKRHGLWIGRSKGGYINTFYFDTYVNGKKHGPWFRRVKTPRGISTRIGTFVNGKSHGQSVDITNGDNVSTGAYVNGMRHGQWIAAGDNRLVLFKGRGPSAEIGAYVNDIKHGQWIELFEEVVRTGAYVDGKRHGRWKRRSITTCEIIEYESDSVAKKRKC